MKTQLIVAAGLLATVAVNAKPVTKAPFGKTKAGVAVEAYTLTNKKGAQMKVMNYGATVVSLKVPDAKGKLGDVVWGFDTFAPYEPKSTYFGAVVGRYGNRIAKGKFTVDGKEYTLATNNGENHLHGGVNGFDRVVWSAKPVKSAEGPAVEFTYVSKDGEEGYPGNLNLKMVYTLTNKNEFKIEYTATTDKTTVCNPTHHSFFNLAGKGLILDHQLQIFSDGYTPVDAGLIPTGEIVPVKDTPFDFNTPTAIGARIDQDNAQLKLGKGYDHNWVIARKTAKDLELAVRVTEPKSGRVMEVLTTEPGVQFYSGNFLDSTLTGKGGQVYPFRSAMCFEPQHYPDSPNQAKFPSCTLKPGETYRQTTVYRFSTVKGCCAKK